MRRMPAVSDNAGLDAVSTNYCIPVSGSVEYPLFTHLDGGIDGAACCSSGVRLVRAHCRLAVDHLLVHAAGITTGRSTGKLHNTT